MFMVSAALMMRLAVGVNALDDFLNGFIGLVVIHLAGADLAVTAAAVFQAELADIGLGGAVDDGVADGDGAVLFAPAVDDPEGNILLGIHGVDQEAVAGPDGADVPEVGDDTIGGDGGVLLDHRHELLVLFPIELNTLLDVGVGEDFRDALGAHGIHQLFHQGVVGNAEFPEAAQAGAGVHQKAQEDPVLGVEDLVGGELGRIHLVDGDDHLFKLGHLFLPAVVFVDDPGGGILQAAFPLKFDFIPQALAFAGVVIEPHAAAGDIGNIGEDVVLRHLDEAVLDILGVNEFPAVDDAQMLE